jgi:putative tryptophan/tyrosine transport system substrate-binding protein
MKRREFITLIGGAAAALPTLPAIAQAPTKRAVIGVLLAGSDTATQQRRSGFPVGMQELGYVQGRDYVIEDRYADGDLTRIPLLVQELVQLKSDVIVTGTTVGAREVKRQTETIPIVGVSLTDPVGFGLAASLARPASQVTGILIISDGFARKQVELALEVVPGAMKIGMLVNVSNQSNAVHRRNVEVAVDALALKLVAGEAHGPDDLDAAFQTMMREHAESVLVPPDGLFVSERRRIVTLAAAARLPALYPYREQVDAGGLMSYGVNLHESWRRAAAFVDKILKGAKPGDLPIEQPANELVINTKTANALGLTVPQSLLSRADEVIG